MNRHWKAALCLLLTIVISLASLGAETVETYTLSILKGPSGMAAAWMMKDPPVAGPARVQFSVAGGADIVTAKLVSGEIQGAVLPLNVAVKLYNSGIPLKALAVVGNGMVKFLSADPAIKSLENIRGREIYVAGQKATPDYLFRYLTGKAGLKAGTDYVPKYNLAYPEMAAQLAAGRIDAAVMPEPFATQALKLNPELRQVADLDELWKEASGLDSYPMSLFVISDKLTASKTGIVDAIDNAYRASIEKTVKEPAESARLIESLDLGMKAAVAEAAIPKSAYVYLRASELRSSIEAMLSLFLEADPISVGGRLPDEKFYY
ncbi:MAG: MqnA/MqnD/SBP family protein [Spirochaetia bacterium]|jgi:NitT/TauT family transport system substrate-binding protein|nr:ABC transporter substrate-binding protein [Spirochaetales bacterium]MDX9783203.1 MqnA/MqnD/SBP family protein [Spirochaetia bacterium]